MQEDNAECLQEEPKTSAGVILNAVQNDAYLRMGQLADWKGRIIPVPSKEYNVMKEVTMGLMDPTIRGWKNTASPSHGKHGLWEETQVSGDQRFL